jgi:hypothetical protein
MENEIERLMEKIERKIKDAKDSGDKEQLERLKQEAEVQKEELDYEKKNLRMNKRKQMSSLKSWLVCYYLQSSRKTTRNGWKLIRNA